MSAKQILEQCRDGKRMPVRGPFTYAEAQRLVALNDKLLATLKETSEMLGQVKQIPARAQYMQACALIAEAEAT